MIRAFVGVPIPQSAVHALTLAQAGLDVGHPVPPENFHITLAFLGEHQEPVIEEIADALALINAEAFSIQISGLGTFGSAPRILFADIPPTQPLSSLRKQVRRAARQSGIDLPHEKYHPHVTLARFGRGLVGDDAEFLRAHIARRIGQIDAQFNATEFALFESHLGRAGPIYTALASFPLTPSTTSGASISS